MLNRKAPVIGCIFLLCVAGLAVAYSVDAFGKSSKRAVETDQAPKAIGPYSQAIIADGFVFVSGQIGMDPKTGKLVEGGIEAETEQAVKNVEAILKAADSDFENAVKATIFLSDINDFAKVNEVYARYLKTPYPARATVQAARLPRDAKVEIEMTALVRKK